MTVEVFSGDLRQGDICEVDFFPQWNLKETMQTSRGGMITHLTMPEFKQCATSNVTQGRRLVAVCSYDCDIENPRSRKGLLIAPLIAVKPEHKQYADLAACADPIHDPAGDAYTYTFVNFFPFIVPDVLAGAATLGTVEFSSMTSVGPAQDAKESLLKSKVHELTEQERVKFQKKLAVFVSRIESAA